MTRAMLSILLLLVSMRAVYAADKPKAQEPSSAVSVEVRAQSAFDRGDYVTALPLLNILARQYQEQPEKLGPIQERIRVCQVQIAQNPPADLQAQANAIKTSPEQRRAHVRPKDGQAYEVGIKELGNFEYDAEKGVGMPEDVKKLSGVKLKTRGFMIPLDQADNISEFALVPSLFACCFGQPPQVQHTLVVRTPKGKAVAYFPDEIVVEGTLKVNEKKEDGLVVSVFEVDCISVKPAPK